ncbi:MAG TPA: hypothetical protein VM513_18400 [Kofleriaceae bacterium]|nr:hypothetical protein [Kofleriaceae bacterium]
MRRLLASLAFVVLGSAPAAARSEKTVGYARDQAWPTAVRFLVVDEHLKITDKDADAGYVMFELREENKVFRGALELVQLGGDKTARVKFVLHIEDRPDWVEIAMLTRLERKLRAELGSPSPAPTKPKADDAPKEAPKDPPKPDDGGPPISSTP